MSLYDQIVADVSKKQKKALYISIDDDYGSAMFDLRHVRYILKVDKEIFIHTDYDKNSVITLRFRINGNPRNKAYNKLIEALKYTGLWLT